MPIPSKEMAEEAARGLAWRKEFNRGGTEVGVARARDIKNRRNLSEETVKRMNSYFARHGVDKEGEGWSPGEKGYPSAGRIAWALWGGNAGKSWANANKPDEKEFIMETFTKSASASLVEDGEEGIIQAYITTFGNADAVGDVIDSKALDSWLKSFKEGEDKLVMLYGHDTMSVIGHWTKFQKTEKGVIAEGEIYTEVTQANDVYKLLKRGAVASVSIGFRSNDYDYLDNGGRKFNDITLVETSVVLNPANPQAKILTVKSDDGLIEVKQLKQLLRDNGLSRKEIEALFHGGFSELKNLRKSEEAAVEEIVEEVIVEETPVEEVKEEVKSLADFLLEVKAKM